MKNLARLNKYFIKYKWHLLLGTCFVSLSNYFGLLIPRKIRQALDFVHTELVGYNELGEDLKTEAYTELTAVLLNFALVVIGFVILKGILMYFMRQTVIVMSRLIEYDMRKEIFAHLEKLDIAFYKRNKTGDLMSRIMEDVNKVRNYLGPALLYGLNLVSLFIMAIYIMFKVNVTLTLYTLLPLPLLSISIYLVSSRINKKSERIQRQLATLNSISQEVYSGIRVVKSYVKEDQFGQHFDQESKQYLIKSLDLARTKALFLPLMILLISMSTLLVLYIGGIEVSKGNITYGNIAEFIIYVNMLTWPVTAIGWIASIVQEAEASQKRINELLKTEPQIINTLNQPIDLKGHIQFKDVTFTYPDTGITALKNINFDLKPGEKMAIIGRTASGKSTIADLILRMYDVSSGNITLDGEDIREIDLDNIRQKIGYVPQDVFLFSDTIANNIAFGNREASKAEIETYAGYAAVKDDILKLPEGFETMVGERGVTLSGGQKQRVSIARAFLKNPDIVILDDCLSAVDTNTEQQILTYLNEALKNKTAIIITHRIFSLLDFDKIIVLEEGKIVEQGTHDTLVAKGGYYQELLEQQKLEESP